MRMSYSFKNDWLKITDCKERVVEIMKCLLQLGICNQKHYNEFIRKFKSYNHGGVE